MWAPKCEAGEGRCRNIFSGRGVTYRLSRLMIRNVSVVFLEYTESDNSGECEDLGR